MSNRPKEENQKRVCIAKIAGVHGVKGLVKIKPFCDDITLLNETLFTDETGENTITLMIKHPSGKYLIAEVDGITTREQAEKLKCSLYVPRETLPKIDNDNEYYIEDLAGLNALNQNKEPLGTILAVQNYGAGDLLELKPTSGASYFIPFQDEYVKDINLDENYIILENAETFIIE